MPARPATATSCGWTTGSTVRDAHAWLEVHGRAYAEANASCWGRLTHASQSPRTPLVVSPVTVGDRLKPAAAALVVVDGFHRALGYWMAGHRTCLAYRPVMTGDVHRRPHRVS